MTELKNRNLEVSKVKYFYMVSEFVTTFGLDVGKNKPISHNEYFKGDDLLQCKLDAEKWFWKRRVGLENTTYFLPFAAYEDFKEGKNAVFSISLSLVEYYNEEEEYEEEYDEGKTDNPVPHWTDIQDTLLREDAIRYGEKSIKNIIKKGEAGEFDYV